MGKVGWPPPLPKPLSPASTINMANNLSLFSLSHSRGALHGFDTDSRDTDSRPPQVTDAHSCGVHPMNETQKRVTDCWPC